MLFLLISEFLSLKENIQKYGIFYGEFENEQKNDKIFGEFEPQIFSNFPAHDLKVRVTRSNQNKLIKEVGL